MRTQVRFALVLAVLPAAGSCVGQTSSSTTARVVQARIVATRIEGEVRAEEGKRKRALKDNDPIAPGTTVTTSDQAGVVLVFSNGLTAALKPDSELRIERFLQDPVSAEIDVNVLAEEPSVSKITLRFMRGELIANIKRLRWPNGSELLFETPAGVGAPRGTTIRMRLTPKDAGNAEFFLEAIEGVLSFQPKSGGPLVLVVPGRSYTATIKLAP